MNMNRTVFTKMNLIIILSNTNKAFPMISSHLQHHRAPWLSELPFTAAIGLVAGPRLRSLITSGKN
jgi:hypothetical protein